MRKSLVAAAVAAALALSPAAFAQAKKGPNGGQLAGEAGHETELVLSATELSVYFIDDGKPHSAKGASAKAIIQQGGKATQVELKNVGDAKLAGALTAPVEKGAIVVLSGKDDHGHAISARYVIE